MCGILATLRDQRVGGKMTRKLAVVLIGVLGLAACGRGQDAAVSVDASIDAHALAHSADQTAQAGTGHAHLTMSMDLGDGANGGPGSFTVSGDGDYDTDAGLSSMTIDMGAMFDQLPGASTGGAGTSEEIVQQGTVTYLRMGLFSAFDPTAADKWIKFDLGKGSQGAN